MTDFLSGMGMPSDEEMQRIRQRQAEEMWKQWEITLADRQRFLRFAAIMCVCRSRYDHRKEFAPPSAGCPVHSQIMVSPDGKVY